MSDPRPPDELPEQRRCLNCEAALVGEYCARCGQRDLPSRLALRELLREVASETFELDGRVARTLVPFVFRPGFLTREYVAGRRARYTSPFRLFLAATLVWLFASFIAGQRLDLEAELGEGDAIQVDAPEIGDGPLKRWLIERGEALERLPESEQASRFISAARETLPTAALLTIPLFALLMKLLFIRQGRYYVEHLVFALHVHAFGFVLLAIAALLPDPLVVWVLLLLGAYVYVALWKSYEARWWTSALRLAALGFVHSLVLGITAILLILFKMLAG